MRILFLPNWNVNRLSTDDPTIQPPDKEVEGKPYWFFRYFPQDTAVDIIDRGRSSWFHKLEVKLKFYILQPVKAFVRRNDYDLVISHGAQSGLVYELLASFVRHKPQHIMIDVGGLNGARVNHTETPLLRWALRRGPHIVVHSSRQLALYAKHYPALAPRARFIPFGADASYFNRSSEPEQPIIVSFGSIKRDYDTLLRAWQAIPDHRGHTLYLIGANVQPAPSIPDVEIMPRVPISQLQHTIASCTMVVLPLPEHLYSYGQMSLLQSMLMGKPVIVSNTTSTADYIHEAPGVIGVTPCDSAGMAHAIEHMLSLTPQQRAEMGAAGSEHVASHFSEEQMGHAFARLARQVTSTQQSCK